MPTLIHCPTCQKDVSTDAKRCPHCGRNIDAYLKAENANAPHYHEINKAYFKVILIIFVTIWSIMAFAFFAIICFSFRQFSIAANVFTALFVISLLIGFPLVGFLIYKAVHVIKKQSKIIKNEKNQLISEDYFR